MKFIIFIFTLIFSYSVYANQNLVDNNHCNYRYASDFITNENIFELCYPNFEIGYNQNNMHPKWVRYSLTSSFMNVCNGRSNTNWFKDQFVQTPNPNAFSNSYYDRGHAVPDADMNWNINAQKQTYTMANVWPQHRSFNRGTWLNIETAVRKLASESKALLVVKGAIGSIGTINNINIPEYFYVYVFQSETNLYDAIIVKHSDKIDIKKITVEELENITNVKGFIKTNKSNLIDITKTFKRNCK